MKLKNNFSQSKVENNVTIKENCCLYLLIVSSNISKLKKLTVLWD